MIYFNTLPKDYLLNVASVTGNGNNEKVIILCVFVNLWSKCNLKQILFHTEFNEHLIVIAFSGLVGFLMTAFKAFMPYDVTS